MTALTKPFAIGTPVTVGPVGHLTNVSITPAQRQALVAIARKNPVLVKAAVEQVARKYKSGIRGLGQSSSGSSSGSFWSDLTSTITALTPDFTAYEQSQNLPATSTATYTNGLLASNGIAVQSSGLSGLFSGTTGIILIGGIAVLAVVMMKKKKKS